MINGHDVKLRKWLEFLSMKNKDHISSGTRAVIFTHCSIHQVLDVKRSLLNVFEYNSIFFSDTNFRTSFISNVTDVMLIILHYSAYVN